MASARGDAPFLTDAVYAAEMYLAASAAGDECGPSYTDVVALARQTGQLGHPSVMAAGEWNAWRHPRGKDGQFLEKLSQVDVYADPNARVGDHKASRRRAKITQLTEQGATVTYTGPDGAPLPPDPDNGFPAEIPADVLQGKIAKAPRSVARIDPTMLKTLTTTQTPRPIADDTDRVGK